MKKFCDSFFVLIKQSLVRKCGKLSGFLRFRVHKTKPCPKSSAKARNILALISKRPEFPKDAFSDERFPV